MRISANVTVTVTAKLSGGERPEYRARGGIVVVDTVIAEFGYPRGDLTYAVAKGHLRPRPGKTGKAFQEVYVGGWVPENLCGLLREMSRASDARLLSGNV